MVMPLNDKKTIIMGILITLGITILGGYIITSFMLPNCKDFLC